MDSRNIVITGFMGTGKTTVGQLLAERLHRPFLDMDARIEAQFGKPIPDIFADEGEAVFRAAEAKLCRKFAQERGVVISTGGGALVDPANYSVLAETGAVFCLTASTDAIFERVQKADNRPLLPGSADEQRRRIQALLSDRRDAYASIQYQVETTDRSPFQVAEEILAMLEAGADMPTFTRIPVHGPGGDYDILIGVGLLAYVGERLIEQGVRPGPVAIASNSDIASHYADPLATGLRAAGFEPHVCLVPEGEQYKNVASITLLYDQFVEAGLDRSSPVIALGGGVVGDMAGFAAASYLRGVPFVQIPTTLLSMVDSSVGGKTGVDLPQGKNLVGAFKQAEVVIIDTDVMRTLPPAEFRAGLAEVVKHGIIGAPELFAQLEADGPSDTAQLVADAVRVKVEVVEEDPFEQGRRATLNLGHTFGHALELVSGFKVRHGEGVALGLVAAANMAVALGECSPELAGRIKRLLKRLELPVNLSGYDAEDVMEAMGQDKKRVGKTLRFIIPRDLGDVTIIDNPGDAYVMDALRSILTHE